MKTTARSGKTRVNKFEIVCGSSDACQSRKGCWTSCAHRYNLGLIGLVLLTYLEVPAWCHGSGESHGLFEWVEGSAWCQIPSHGKEKANPNLSGV
eukprot:2571573-Amphidinium_carterae.1